MNSGNCLLTGYPGFLGSRLHEQLSQEYRVYSLGLGEAAAARHTIADLSKAVPKIDNVRYDLVVHAAGKAHSVPRTPDEEELFYRVNEQGTLNLLTALKGLSEPPRAMTLVSTVAVYGCDEGERITEDRPACASDAYGRSKAAAEAAVQDWNAPGTVKSIIRLPLIVGKNAPGNLGRMVAAIRRGRYVNIAGGHAKRSFVWIDDVARFIVRLAAERQEGIYNLTDGVDVTYAELSEALCRLLGHRRPLSLPFAVAKPMALAGDALSRVTGRRVPFDSTVLRKMTSELTFSCEKAVRGLLWKPTRVLDRIGDVI